MKTLLLWQFSVPWRCLVCVVVRCHFGAPLCHQVWSGNNAVTEAWAVCPFAFLFIQTEEESRCWKTVIACLCMVMRRICLLWYVTWPGQETVPGTEKGLCSTTQNMATVANSGVSGLDNILYFSYFYLFIYAFVSCSGHVTYGRMPRFQSFSVASYLSPTGKYSECWSLPRISIYSFTASWLLIMAM